MQCVIEQLKGPTASPELHITQRLDQPTCGLMLLAKSKSMQVIALPRLYS